jgi:hypothetical protein
MGGFLAGLMVYGRVLLDRIKQAITGVLGKSPCRDSKN